VKRLRGFLSNPRLDFDIVFRHLVRLGLVTCKIPNLDLPILLDPTYFGDYTAVVAAIPYAGRALPAAVRHRMGLDQPIPVQYAIWLWNALHGDFGKSFVNSIPVADLALRKVPATFELAAGGLLFTIVIGLPLGIVAAMRRSSVWDYLIGAFSATSLGLPVFLTGILLIAFFALQLGWLPSGGRVAFHEDLWLGLQSLFLPAFSLGLAHAPILIRFVRNSILEVMHEDYVRTAYAKGLEFRTVLIDHVLKNAMVPVVTIMGIVFGRLLGGVVITEAVFAWPGMGSTIITAIGNRDYSLVQMSLLLIVTAFVMVNLMVDVLYGWLDPRIRLRGN
jgi:peptide/nickel transport system permease protein